MDVEFVEVIRRTKSFTLTPANIKAIRGAMDDGEWREDIRADAWAGRVIGKVLKLDPRTDRAAIKQALNTLIAAGDLKIVAGVDRYRNSVRFVVIA